MKAVLVLCLAAFLVPCALPAPMPQPSFGLLNLFGNIITDSLQSFQQVFTGSLASLNNLATAIIKPVPLAGPIISEITTSLNNLLNTGLISTTNVLVKTVNRSVSVTESTLNRLVTIANQIIPLKIQFLTNIFNVVANALTRGLDMVAAAIEAASGVVGNILGGIGNLLSTILGTLTGTLDACNAKLNSLGMSSTVTQMNKYKADVAAIVKSLETDSTGLFTDFSTAVNSSATELALDATDITTTLLAQLQTVATDPAMSNSADFQRCLVDSADLVAYLEIIMLENLAVCVDQSAANEKSAVDSLKADSEGIPAAGQGPVTAVCDCLSSVTAFSNMIVKTQAKTCANAAAAKLDTTEVETKATEITANLDAKLDEAKAEFEQCMVDIEVQIPEVVDYVGEYIDSCKTM